jgi:hypothetical protein
MEAGEGEGVKIHRLPSEKFPDKFVAISFSVAA